MSAPADVLPLTIERGGAPQWRLAEARSVQDRRDVPEFDTPATAGVRRVTTELIEFHRNRALDLRATAIRNAGIALWSLVTKIIRPR